MTLKAIGHVAGSLWGAPAALVSGLVCAQAMYKMGFSVNLSSTTGITIFTTGVVKSLPSSLFGISHPMLALTFVAFNTCLVGALGAAKSPIDRIKEDHTITALRREAQKTGMCYGGSVGILSGSLAGPYAAVVLGAITAHGVSSWVFGVSKRRLQQRS